MVRGKVELRQMDVRERRLVSFSQRRNGLLKKARELAVVCDAEVGVIVFSPKGKLSHFSSQSSLEDTIQRYERFLDAETSVKNDAFLVEGQDVGATDQETERGGSESKQRFFGARNVEQMIVNELTKLEEKLKSTLREVKSRKAVGMDVEDREEEDEPGGSQGSSGGSNDAAEAPPSRYNSSS